MSFILIIFSVIFSTQISSMELSVLGKRDLELRIFEEPQPKMVRSLQQHALENLENIARENVDFTGEIRAYLLTHMSIADELGNTLVHYAVLSHNHDLLKDILKRSNYGNCHRSNNQGLTPLEYAVQANNPDAVRELLEVDPSFLEVFKSLNTAYIINNKDNINELEKYLLRSEYKSKCCAMLMNRQIKTVANSNFETMLNFDFFNKLKSYEKVITKQGLLCNFEDSEQTDKLDPNWQDNFEPEIVAIIKEIIADPQNYSWFIHLFSEQKQQRYFIIFIELFFGSAIADIAHQNPYGFVWDEELRPFLDKIPSLTVKLINESFLRRDISTLKMIFTHIPEWFINCEKIKRKQLFCKMCDINSSFYDAETVVFYIHLNRFNINQRIHGTYKDCMLEILILGTTNMEIFKKVLEYKANINYRDKAGRTLLMNLAYFDYKIDLFSEVMKQNPELTLVDTDSKTVFDIAIAHGNYRAVKLLLENQRNHNSHCYLYRDHYLARAEAKLRYQLLNSKDQTAIIKSAMIVDEFNKISKPD